MLKFARSRGAEEAERRAILAPHAKEATHAKSFTPTTRLVWVNYEYSSVFGTKALSTLLVQFTRARASEWTAAAAAVV
eukprot:97063-Prymnesium_polylepis.1